VSLLCFKDLPPNGNRFLPKKQFTRRVGIALRPLLQNRNNHLGIQHFGMLAGLELWPE